MTRKQAEQKCIQQRALFDLRNFNRLTLNKPLGTNDLITSLQIWLSYSTEVFLEAGIKDYYAQYASLLMSIPQAAISVLLAFYLESFSRKDLIVIPTLGSAFFASIAIIGLGMSRTATTWALVVPVMAAADLFTAAIASESVYAVRE